MILLVKYTLRYSVFFLSNAVLDPLNLFHDPLVGYHLQFKKHQTR